MTKMTKIIKTISISKNFPILESVIKSLIFST
jgi:hypothetical protein